MLERYPTAQIQMYTIWMPVLPGDRQSAWDGTALDDPRVTQLWDGGHVLGSWEQAHGQAFWDSFLLYGPDATWGDQPTLPLATGSPIIGSTNVLNRALATVVSH